jgi:hypothetical protein
MMADYTQHEYRVFVRAFDGSVGYTDPVIREVATEVLDVLIQIFDQDEVDVWFQQEPNEDYKVH